MHIDRTAAVTATNAPETVLSALVHGLETEFGHEVSLGLAQRFLDAEEADFLWDARIAERWLGQYESAFEEEVELDRIAVLGAVGTTPDWYVAVLIVDGEGAPHGTIARSEHATRAEAEIAWVRAGGSRTS